MTSLLQIQAIPKALADSSANTFMINRIPITDINPSVFFGGEFVPVKAIAGEEIEVSATIFREGHDALGADVLLFDRNGLELSRTRMREHGHGSDRFSTWIRIPARGDFTYVIESFDDPFATWHHDSEIKIPADIDAELCCTIGLEIFEAKLIEDASAKKLLSPAIKALGDSAYPRRTHLLKHPSYRMAQKRIVVEWGFGKMQQLFAVTDFEAHLQVYLNRPARTYLVCAILCNMHTCCYGSQTGRYFRCRPPTLEDYCSM